MSQTVQEIAKDILVAALAKTNCGIGAAGQSDAAAESIAKAYKIIHAAVKEAKGGGGSLSGSI
ncbi:hypothetical protein [Xanthomonas euroxanthea]|uniref:Uncharacterized protein n=1 Tax=Xanthomonas euroxanthea TaxID=2259622 RepID=A0AA46C7Q7_9XANT|nr:hypothetical protein [Xanthomonas euroxanthea]CAE1135342.1 hypothetical protein XTG_001664 [Xanthomonas euroxanthea]SUZ27887.1 hypothetical protein CPBF424_16830 [Xanthomonas euroxanthea]